MDKIEEILEKRRVEVQAIYDAAFREDLRQRAEVAREALRGKLSEEDRALHEFTLADLEERLSRQEQ